MYLDNQHKLEHQNNPQCEISLAQGFNRKVNNQYHVVDSFKKLEKPNLNVKRSNKLISQLNRRNNVGCYSYNLKGHLANECSKRKISKNAI